MLLLTNTEDEVLKIKPNYSNDTKVQIIGKGQ